MYYYFFLKAIGISPWWKRFVTSFQIVQFMSSLVAVAAFFYIYYVTNEGREEGEGERQCGGYNVIVGQLIFNVTLLLGFVGVLNKGGGGKKEKKRDESKRK
jgi:hypothetical protein